VDLYVHSPIRLHGVMLNCTGTTLSFTFIGTVQPAAKSILNKTQFEFIDCLKSDSSYEGMLDVTNRRPRFSGDLRVY
jgi:hypothetical protein